MTHEQFRVKIAALAELYNKTYACQAKADLLHEIATIANIYAAQPVSKGYAVGIEEVCPTDCTLYVTDGARKKVFLIDSPAWYMAGYIYDSRLRAEKNKPGHIAGDNTHHCFVDANTCWSEEIDFLLRVDTECSEEKTDHELFLEEVS